MKGEAIISHMKMVHIGMVTRMEVPMPMMEITIITTPIHQARTDGITMETKTTTLPVEATGSPTQDMVEDKFQWYKWILHWKMTAWNDIVFTLQSALFRATKYIYSTIISKILIYSKQFSMKVWLLQWQFQEVIIRLFIFRNNVWSYQTRTKNSF